MEDIDLLHSRLVQWELHATVLPRPSFEEVTSVCGKWLLFACGGHSDTLYQQRARVEQARSATFSRLSQVALTSPRYVHVRRPQSGAVLALHANIRYFVKETSVSGLIQPNSTFIILPWNSVPSAHAAYVRLREKDLSWAESEWVGQNEGRTVTRRNSRYGNRLLGPKDPAKPEDKNTASLSHFHQVWLRDVELDKYIIRRWIPFAKCGACSDFKLREKAEKDPVLRKALQMAQDFHLRDVEFERRAYYSNQCRAECEPETYLSIITDGADQSDHELPHFHERSHSMDTVQKQKLHVYGALAHGRRAFAFTLPAHCQQGHNTTIEVLWRVFNYIRTTEKKLPPVLLLQLDNTTKQNKGKYLYSFLFLLVHHRVFERIIVTYLPSGHTHEDIDQMFSRFAIALRKKNALTRTEMGNVLQRAFTYCDKDTVVEHMDTCANFSGWIRNQRVFKTTGTPECMSHRHFRIKLNKEGKTLLQVRSSPIVSFLSEPWQGLQGDTVEHDMFPHGMPTFAADVQANLIPACALPKIPLTARYVEDVKTSLSNLQTKFGTLVLSDQAMKELTDLAEMTTQERLPFQWDKSLVLEVFKPPPESFTQLVSIPECLPFPVKVGAFYIVQPSEANEDDEDAAPFWIVRVHGRGHCIVCVYNNRMHFNTLIVHIIFTVDKDQVSIQYLIYDELGKAATLKKRIAFLCGMQSDGDDSDSEDVPVARLQSKAVKPVKPKIHYLRGVPNEQHKYFAGCYYWQEDSIEHIPANILHCPVELLKVSTKQGVNGNKQMVRYQVTRGIQSKSMKLVINAARRFNGNNY